MSLGTFKATIYCAIAGIVIIIAIPKPGFRETAGITARIIAISGFGLVAIAFLANIISLVTGTIAWARGSQGCGWIFISTLIVIAPLGLWLAL
jgi:hypothetical protein